VHPHLDGGTRLVPTERIFDNAALVGTTEQFPIAENLEATTSGGHRDSHWGTAGPSSVRGVVSLLIVAAEAAVDRYKRHGQGASDTSHRDLLSAEAEALCKKTVARPRTCEKFLSDLS